MFPSRDFLFRFLMTYGLLGVIILAALTIFLKPLKNHIALDQRDTAFIAKSRVLSYQTPNFALLAKDIFEGHVFSPDEMETYRTGQHYLSFYTKASELFPDQFEMFYLQGICHFWQKDGAATENALKQSLQLNPVFFWGYYNLGLLYLEHGQIDAAITLLTLAQRMPPAMTIRALRDLQAFYIIWHFMPDPGNYISHHLQEGFAQANTLLSIAKAIKDHRESGVHFDPNQWNPVFF